MDFTTALLYSLIGIYQHENTLSVDASPLGVTQFSTYKGKNSTCAVQYTLKSGVVASSLEIKPSVSPDINPLYGGLGADGPERKEYLPHYFNAASLQKRTDYILLQSSSDFTLQYQSIDKLIMITQKVRCDAASCTCTVKL